MTVSTRKMRLIVASIAILALTGCRVQRNIGTNGSSSGYNSAASAIRFSDITAKAGIKFLHHTGAFGGKFMPETTGSGMAFIDYDGDGYQDIYLVNSRDWTAAEVDAYKKGKWKDRETQDFMKKRGLKSVNSADLIREGPGKGYGQRVTGKLYHNNRNGTFTDVTKTSGLDVEMYGMGTAVGDYDNDGWPDLYVTAVGHNYLFHNEAAGPGKRHFVDVAAKAGVQDAAWSTAAAWLDYDKDGKLDIFVGHYVIWSPFLNAYSAPKGVRIYSGPGQYDGQTSSLYHNLGGGKFENVSAKVGIQQSVTADGKPEKLEGKALGVAVLDYNNDGWTDIFVTNDKQRNFLFKNNMNGSFTEVAVQAGIAYSESGKMRAGMGVDTADIDHTGHESIITGNFSDEMLGLYQDQGDGVFVDTAPSSEVGRASLGFLTFGLCFLDIDNDGWPDIFVANGHIDNNVKAVTGNIEYAERPLVFHNNGFGRFQEIGLQSGEAMKKPIVARGLAYADVDLDGDPDVLLTTNAGPAILLRNDGGNKNNSVRLVLQGTKSNRSAIGAKVEATVGTETLHRMVRSGSSYLSQSELPLTLGLGKETKVSAVTIHWPSGATTQLKDVAANQIVTVLEGKGIVNKQPFAKQHVPSVK